jgi:hypothetical protein
MLMMVKAEIQRTEQTINKKDLTNLILLIGFPSVTGCPAIARLGPLALRRRGYPVLPFRLK